MIGRRLRRSDDLVGRKGEAGPHGIAVRLVKLVGKRHHRRRWLGLKGLPQQLEEESSVQRRRLRGIAGGGGAVILTASGDPSSAILSEAAAVSAHSARHSLGGWDAGQERIMRYDGAVGVVGGDRIRPRSTNKEERNR